MLDASLLWYRKIKSDLESEGFVFNPYDSCIANRAYLKTQQTIRLHVDDMLVPSKNKKANNNFHKWCESKYGGLKPVKCNRGKVHEFIGMQLDFGRSAGSCHIMQDIHVRDMIDAFCKQDGKTKLKGDSPSPEVVDLFRRRAGGLLSDKGKRSLSYLHSEGYIYR